MSGPSGTGKSTILKRLFDEYPDRFGFSVSRKSNVPLQTFQKPHASTVCTPARRLPSPGFALNPTAETDRPSDPDTTRAPRPGEKDGQHYHFTTRDDFTHLTTQAFFLEHATFGSNNYGTSVRSMETIAARDKICILDIEMDGATQVSRHPQYGLQAREAGKKGTARFIFVAPPSLEVLEQRLRGRGTESEDALRGRLDRARVEMEWADEGGVVDKVVVNDDLDRAYQEVRSWIFEGE